MNFLEDKVESPTYLFSLLEDLRSARAELPHHLPVAKRLTVLREIIWRSATLLLEHPTMLLQCLCNEGGWDNVAATRHEARPFSKSEQTALQAMRLMAQPLAFPAIKRVLARRRTGLSGFSTLLHGWWFRKISEQKSWTWLHALRPSDRVSGAITKAIIRVHSAAVYCLSVTSDLSISVTASADGTIRIVDLAQQREVVRIAHPHGRVSAIALFPDGERFAAASWEDDACLVYDRATGTLLFSHRTAPALPVSLAISPDGAMIAMGCSDGTIQVVDASCQRVIQRWAAHLGSVMALAFSRTGEMLVSGAREQESIRVWHTADWTQATVVQPASVGRAYRNFEVESVACSPTRNMFASGHVDGSIRLWSLPEGELLRTFQGITWPVLSISFSADGQRLIAGGHNGESLVWDTETATVVGVPSGHVGHVWGACLSADGTSCVLAADDGAIRVFALQSGNFLAIENHRGGITGVMTIPDANQFVTVGYDGIVRIWGASTGELQMRFVAGNAIQSACTDSIRRIIYVYTSAGHLELFDLETGQQRISVRVNPAGMPGVIGLSEDGVTLALATSHQLRFFNCQPSCAAGQDEIQLVERHEPTGSRFDDITNLYLDNLKAPLATAITFSPDAANVAVGFEDGVVRLFAVRNARPMMTYLGLTEPIIEIALGDSDDSFLSAVTAKETVCWQQHHPQQPSYRGTVTDPREIATFSMGQGTHLGVTSLSAVLIIDSQNVAWFPASIRRIKRLGKSARWFVSDGNHVNVLESKSFQIRSVIEHADVTIWHFDSKTVVMAYHHSLLGEQPLNQFYHLIEEMVNLEIRHLILDFHRIRWMSSLALGGLVRISKTLQHNDVTISIVGLNDHNKGTILWCRLDERLRVFDAVEEAIRYGDRPLRRDRTELEIAISRLSGSERDILDAISDGRSAEAHQMMNGLLNIIGEESGWASLIAGLACRLAGTICALSQRWETGIRSFFL